jgi:hypothetical protein
MTISVVEIEVPNAIDVTVSEETLSVDLNADFHGAKSLNVSLWDCPGFARKFGKFATETLIGLFCQVWF